MGIWKNSIRNTDFYHKRMLDQEEYEAEQVIKRAARKQKKNAGSKMGC
jgi:uncharacterized protein YqgQ